MSNDTDAPAPLRKFSWPFAKRDTPARRESTSSEVTDPQDYYDALALAEDGFYPIGANGQWHGGIHFGRQTGTLLDQDNGIRCIADGEVIAWKIDDTYPTVEYDTCGAAKYSTGFVLARHRLALPPAPTDQQAEGGSTSDEPTLLFYSLYIHLRDWQGYRQAPDDPRPPFWGERTYVVGDRAFDADRNRNPHIPEGGVGLNLRNAANAVVGFAPRGTRLRFGERRGTSGYYAVTEVVSGSVFPTGLSDAYAFRDEMTAVPAEPATKGSIVIPESPIKISAGALVGHLGEYKRYVDAGAMCSADPRPLAQIDVFTTENIETFIEASRTRAAQLQDFSKTLLVIESGAQLAVPPGGGETPSAEQLTAAHDAGGGPAAGHTRVIPIKALDVVTEEDGTRWWSVDVGAQTGETAIGWVRERDHANVRLASPWEWPGFEIVHIDNTRPDQFYAHRVAQEGDAAPDEQGEMKQRGASADSGPIFRKLYETIDDSGDKKITADEIRRALQKTWLAQALSHLIVKHESEWSGPMAKWDAIDELIPENREKDWAKEKERIASLLWWEDVKGQHGLHGGEPLVATNLHAIGLLATFTENAIDCITYRIRQRDGSLERITPKDINPAKRTIVRYIYIDAGGTEHDVGEYTFSSTSSVGPGNRPTTATSRLVDLRDIDNYASGHVRFGFHYDTRLTLRPYIADHALASLLGAMLDTGFEDVSCNGFSDHRGHSIGGSSSHRNGVNGDFKYFRADGTTQTQSSLHINTHPELMDEVRQNAFNDALHKYGWRDLKAWRYTINGQSRLLNRTGHLANHHHHLHLQGYNPAVTDRYE